MLPRLLHRLELVLGREGTIVLGHGGGVNKRIGGTAAGSARTREDNQGEPNRVFGRGLVEEIHTKFQREGLDKLDTKELLVLVADDLLNEMNNTASRLDRNMENIGRRVDRAANALWAIVLGIFSSLIAGINLTLILAN